MERPTKAKRKLSDISFEREGAHVALVSKQQGGAANGHNYAMVLKSLDFDQEIIEKMQQVRVTMEVPDFLQRFFGLWEGDAKTLAYMMGYVEPAETEADEKMEAEEDFQEWIKERMESFEVIKALQEVQDPAEILSELDGEQYLAFLQDQEMLEKAFGKYDKDKEDKLASEKAKKSKPKVKTVRSYTDPNAMVSKESTPSVVKSQGADKPQEYASEVQKDEVKKPQVIKSTSKDKLMTQEVKIVEQTVETEMVEKSQFDSVQKALSDMQVELQKARDLVAQFEAEKKAAITKARKEKLQAAVKDEAKAEVLFKAASLLEADADFDAVVKALADMQAAVEKSDLFVEKGASIDSEVSTSKESPVAKLLKAKQAK